MCSVSTGLVINSVLDWRGYKRVVLFCGIECCIVGLLLWGLMRIGQDSGRFKGFDAGISSWANSRVSSSVGGVD